MARHKLNTRAAGVISLAVMCSRVLGLVREMVFAGLFGSALMGPFYIAFKVSNLLRDLFAEGALSTAFITVFSQKIEKEGEAAAWRLASKIATLTAVFMSAVALLCIVFAGPLIALIAPGFDEANRELTIWLTRIMYPFILLVSLAALAMGMLNSKNVFGIPALASSFFNIGSIVGGVGIGWLLDPVFGPRALTGLAIGTLVGGFLQLAVQFPSLWKVGFRFRPDFAWRDSGVRRVLVLMTPAVIAGSAVQINVLVNAAFASFIGPDAVSWLQWAFRLMQLPLGVFGVAVATVTLPVVSKIAAGGDIAGFRDTLAKALRLAVFLTLPATVGLAVLAEPIIALLYQRGEFVREDTLATAAALRMYALGLTAYACVKVISPTFYALDKKWTPMVVSFIAIGLNLFLNWLFIFRLGFGHAGLALSTAITATFNFLVLYFLMRRHSGGLESGRFLGAIARCLLATALLAATAWAGMAWFGAWLDHSLPPVRMVALFAVIGAAGGVYLVACWVLRVGEIREAVSAVRARF